MDNSVFRKVSLERLSSPEQLDSLMTITKPRGWFALFGIGALVAAGILWGIFGSVPTKIQGQGVLIKGGGVQNIIPTTTGHLTDIRVAAGDTVKSGQTIARVDQPQLVDEITVLNDRILELKKSVIALKDDPVRRAPIMDEIDRHERNLVKLKERLELTSRIISPYDGRVLEVKVNRGDYITPSNSLLSMELVGGSVKDLEAILYVPAEDGKRILPGMSVQISPAFVNKEEYGFMQGNVVSVSEFPATFQGMMKVFGNEELVKRLSGNSAPIEVRVDLIPDNTTFSGYRWSSGQGPSLKMNSGTLFVGSVTVKRERPINMVVPIFK